MRIFIGEDERYRDEGQFEAIVLAARERGLAGATVSEGFEGHAPDATHVSSAMIELLSDKPPVVLDIARSRASTTSFRFWYRRQPAAS